MLPVLLVLLAMAVWVLAAVSAQLRCTDAAALGARAAARGETSAAVSALAQRAAPAGAVVRVAGGAAQVEVVVRARVRPFGGVLDALPPFEVAGRAVAAREDVVADPGGSP